MKTLAAVPIPSALVKEQQKHGQAYSKAHYRYCLDGVIKANPNASREKCEEYLAHTCGAVPLHSLHSPHHRDYLI